MPEKYANAKSVTTRSLTVILFVLFGILISAQLRSIPSRISNPITPYVTLKETRVSLADEQKQLKNEIKTLHEAIRLAETENQNNGLGAKELDSLQSKKALAGLSRMTGPGVKIVLNDSNSVLVTEDSIIHAADLRDVINLLWGAGAEAISLNDQRVVVNTAIDCIVNTILVNNVRLSTPFTIEAIGNKDRLFDTLANPRSLENINLRKEKNGLVFDVSKNDNLILPLFDGSFEIKMESVK